MEANYVHKDSTTLVQDKLVKNELNQIELQYNALKQQKFNELLKENQELKKQVETYEIEGYEQNEELNKMSFDLKKYKIQQKEFIKYLETWKENEEYCYLASSPIDRCRKDVYEEVLQKYKSIIGVSDEKES